MTDEGHATNTVKGNGMSFDYDKHRRGDFGETWEPDEGDSIVGIALELREADTKYGPKPVLDLQTSDGEKWSIFANRNLLDAMQDAGIDEGDRLKITFTGKDIGTNKKGADYVVKTYAVEKLGKGDGKRKPPAEELVGL